MKKITRAICILSALLGSPLISAQMHKVQKPEKVVRAVGVYEWTGDLPKPTASRLIPVSLAVNGHLEDAGIYLARPVPLALLPGNDYFLQVSGVDRGTLALEYARHLEAADSSYEDGWFGYGTYHPPVAAPRSPVLRASKTNPVIAGSRDSTRPHLSGQSGSSSGTKSTQSSSTDPDRPHLTRKDGTDTADGGSSQDASVAGTGTIADRPTMRRRNTDADTSTASTAKPSGGDPSDDPDRPTLKRHTADDSEKKTRSADDLATVTGTGSLNNDPNRPNLHRGKPTGPQRDNDFSKLTGLPNNLHQMIAVSDAENRPEHDFARAWEDPAERVAVLGGMETLARTYLNAVGGAVPVHPAAARSKAPVRRTTRASRVKLTPAPLHEEELRAYTLSYGGLPTFVYTAHTAGEGAQLRYVTVVAQRDVMGVLKPVMQSTTDAMHLDRVPRMHLVDVVDADASNRASLLFELLAQTSRQFALYRVLGETATQILVTGSTP